MRHQEALFRAGLGALEATEGHAREALGELEAAEDLLRTIEAPTYVAAVAVHRGHLELLLAREAAAQGAEDRAERLVAAARARTRNVPLAASSEDVRIALRLLEGALRGSPAAIAPPAPRAALTVGPDARWFACAAPSPPVDLARRGAVRLILAGLLERHRLAPGTTLDAAALLALGWPGERVLADAGATRVRVAVSTLRRLGLAGILLTRDDGYLLDPRVAITVADEPGPTEG
jgi:hypothetical protein